MTPTRTIGVRAAAALAMLCLAACAGDQAPPATNARMFGLISGPIPAPKPFVVQSRMASGSDYPAVGITPPARRDTPLKEPERAKLEASLKQYSGKPAPPPIKRKKPVPGA